MKKYTIHKKSPMLVSSLGWKPGMSLEHRLEFREDVVPFQDPNLGFRDTGLKQKAMVFTKDETSGIRQPMEMFRWLGDFVDTEWVFDYENNVVLFEDEGTAIMFKMWVIQ